jgi:hypothetical protein
MVQHLPDIKQEQHLKRPFEKSRHRWKDDIKMDLEEIG